MKTLIITLEYPPHVGGIASYVANVAEHMPVRDVVVYAPPVKGDSGFDSAHTWKVYRRNPYWFFVWPQWLRMLAQVYGIVRSEKIERIHVHHALPSGYVALFMKKFLKIPYTVFLHGSDLQLASQHPGKLKKFAWVCREAEKVVVNSQYFKNFLNSKVPGLKNVTIVYPCPPDSYYSRAVDEERVRTLRSQLGLSGKRVMLSASRMVERKGFVLLAKLMPKILERVPNLVWVTVGDGPEKNKVIQVTAENNLQSVVRVLPAVSQDDLFTLYHVADVFVLPTHKDVDGVEEAWGGVFIEAAAAGLPVVAGKSGGVPETVEQNTTGFVVGVENEELLVANIVELLKNPDSAKRMGEAGKRRAISQFAWGPQMDKIF